MPTKNRDTNELLLKLSIWLLTGMLGMNLFFIKDWFDTIKKMNNDVLQLRQDVVVLQAKFDTILQQQRGKE